MPTSLDLKTLLLGALAFITVFYGVVLARGIARARADGASPVPPPAGGTGPGAGTHFHDTPGTGPRATQTAHFRTVRVGSASTDSPARVIQKFYYMLGSCASVNTPFATGLANAFVQGCTAGNGHVIHRSGQRGGFFHLTTGTSPGVVHNCG